MPRIIALGLLALTLSGCAYAKLRNPQTSAEARCGIVPVHLWYSVARANDQVFEEVECIDALVRQGYESIPAGPEIPYLYPL
jgi:hypothetical protein